MFDVPDSISLSKVVEIVAQLGIRIDPDDLVAFRLDMDGVYVEFYDRDADGHRYFNPPGGDEVATHRIAIRLAPRA